MRMFIKKILQEERLTVKFSSGVSKLTVSNLNKAKDAGTYKCIVKAGNRSYTDQLTVNNILGRRFAISKQNHSNSPFHFTKSTI